MWFSQCKIESQMNRNHNHNHNSKKMSDRRNNNKQNDRHSNVDQENRNFHIMYKKLYLDTETADVNFVFDTTDEQVEKVPAHKLLLSVASDGFKKMFAAAEVGQTDFRINDTCMSAFKEFMQFFYLSKVKLTFENIATVMKLAKDYGNEEFMICCSVFLEHKLTMENIIWGYGLAIRFDRTIMKKNFEQKIAENAADVLKSASFFECDREVLNQILQLNALQCDESQVLTGCMSWAKAAIDRKGLDSKNTQLLREELSELLYQIRFKSMTIGNFSMIVGSFASFFTGPELEEIIQMIVSKDYKSEKFNSNFRVFMGGNNNDDRNKDETIECNRYAGTLTSRYYISKIENSRFEMNKPMLLVGFQSGKVLHIKSDQNVNIVAKVSILEDGIETKNPIFTGETTLSSDNETHFTIDCPINIQPNKKYDIVMEQPTTLEHFNHNELKRMVELKNGAKIRFLKDDSIGYDNTKCGLITRMFFKRT